MPIAAWIDQLLPNFVTLGRGANAIGLKLLGTGLEVRDSADTGYRDLRVRDLRLQNLQFDGFPVLGRVFGVARRQTVTLGSINASGQPNALTTPGGLVGQLNASSTNPFSVVFASGFDSVGVPIDFAGAISSNVAFSSLTANATSFFYVERNSSDGSLTTGRVTLQPVYSSVAPASPASGQHWFNTALSGSTTQPGMTMYEWTGSSWTTRQRVFIGEATTSGVAVTAISTYAYGRSYQSAWTAVSGNSNVNFAHNLGMTLAEAEATTTLYGRSSSSDLNHAICPGLWSSGSNYGVRLNGASRLNQSAYLGDGGYYFNGSSWITSGDLMCVVNGGW